MLLTKEGHIKLTDFGLSRISVPEQESDLNQNPQEMLKHLDSMSKRYTASSKSSIRKGVNNGNDSSELVERKMSKRKQNSYSKDKSILGTPDYLAPELLLGLSHGIAVDWWSLGICIFEWLIGYPPFMDDTPELIFSNILSHRIEWPSGELSVNAKNLISNLLNHDQLLRFKAEDVKRHQFFGTLDWNTIRDQAAPFIPKPSGGTDTSYFDGYLLT